MQEVDWDAEYNIEGRLYLILKGGGEIPIDIVGKTTEINFVGKRAQVGPRALKIGIDTFVSLKGLVYHIDEPLRLPEDETT